jgi:hypothetical protein
LRSEKFFKEEFGKRQLKLEVGGIALFVGSFFGVIWVNMTLDEITTLMRACAEQMNSRYAGVVFDEWAVVSLAENKARVLAYSGPRNDDFLKNFVKDLGVLRTALRDENYGVGDFEFSRHGVGTGIEAFLVVGHGFYLICNNTDDSMENIAKNPRWLAAQVPFVELADKVRAKPLEVSSDTRFFGRSRLA